MSDPARVDGDGKNWLLALHNVKCGSFPVRVLFSSSSVAGSSCITYITLPASNANDKGATDRRAYRQTPRPAACDDQAE